MFLSLPFSYLHRERLFSDSMIWLVQEGEPTESLQAFEIGAIFTANLSHTRPEEMELIIANSESVENIL